MSDSVISSNQSIKVSRVRSFQTTTGAGTFDITLAQTTNSSYVEMNYVKISGNSQAGVLLIDVDSGAVLDSVITTTGGGGAVFLFSELAEGLDQNVLSSGNGKTNKRSLVIPPGCRLVGRLTQAGGVQVNSMIAIGTEFINSP